MQMDAADNESAVDVVMQNAEEAEATLLPTNWLSSLMQIHKHRPVLHCSKLDEQTAIDLLHCTGEKRVDQPMHSMPLDLMICAPGEEAFILLERRMCSG